jgi:predicted NBD/HSP70 family sugar kinase
MNERDRAVVQSSKTPAQALTKPKGSGNEMTNSSFEAPPEGEVKPRVASAPGRGSRHSIRPSDADDVCGSERSESALSMRRILAVDVGGSHIKALIGDGEQEIKFDSGPNCSPQAMLTQLRRRLRGRPYDAVSIGIPAPVVQGRLAHEPYNLGPGWQGFDYRAMFGCPVRLINDAAMQALGSYEGGHMLFLGLGTGLGSAMVVDGVVAPMELAHLPYRKHSFEHYVDDRARERLGRKKWQAKVYDVIEVLRAALQPDYVMLGGGNAGHLHELPDGMRLGGNAHAFAGGFRLWEEEPK